MPKNNSHGCCPGTQAKIFELILLIGFLIGIISLTTSLILNFRIIKLLLRVEFLILFFF